jgi:hypothetical protein
VGGWGALKRLGKGKVHLKGDERILCDSDFVEAVLEAQNEKLERHYRLESEGFDIEKVIKRAAYISGQRRADPDCRQGAAAGSGQKPCLLLGGAGTGHDDGGGVKVIGPMSDGGDQGGRSRRILRSESRN